MLGCLEASLSGVLRAISRGWFVGGALLACGRPRAQVRLAFEGAEEGGAARRGAPGWRPATPNAGPHSASDDRSAPRGCRSVALLMHRSATARVQAVACRNLQEGLPNRSLRVRSPSGQSGKRSVPIGAGGQCRSATGRGRGAVLVHGRCNFAGRAPSGPGVLREGLLAPGLMRKPSGLRLGW